MAERSVDCYIKKKRLKLFAVYLWTRGPSVLVLEPREYIHVHEINNTTHKLSMLIQTEEIIFWSKHFHFRMNS